MDFRAACFDRTPRWYRFTYIYVLNRALLQINQKVHASSRLSNERWNNKKLRLNGACLPHHIQIRVSQQPHPIKCCDTHSDWCHVLWCATKSRVRDYLDTAIKEYMFDIYSIMWCVGGDFCSPNLEAPRCGSIANVPSYACWICGFNCSPKRLACDGMFCICCEHTTTHTRNDDESLSGAVCHFEAIS